ncbi:MAG: Crp/Fnr family transcriptional regulator [Chloroflexi bacterium]|nr:Crp/Fnr family transcriptional regulator [Chloroflexota bacterium]
MYDVRTLATRLKAVRHFHDLADADLERIIRAGQVQRHMAGAAIFREGEPCAGMFVLLAGRVHLRKLGPRGQEQIVETVEPVIMFNEGPVLDGGPNVATAVAVDACVTWRVACETFAELLQRYPQIGLGLLRVLAVRNRYLIAQVEDLSFRSVTARVAKLLLELSQQGQTPIERRRHPNHELAARLATVPEAFSRSLGFLRRSGYVDCTRSAIVVRQPQALARLAQVE